MLREQDSWSTFQGNTLNANWSKESLFFPSGNHVCNVGLPKSQVPRHEKNIIASLSVFELEVPVVELL